MAEMKGKNRVGTFRDAGFRIIKELAKHSSVIGALFTGGIARGFADKYSDVDVLVFLERENASVRSAAKSVAKEIEHRFSIETDIEVHVLDTYLRQDWSEYLKWDLSNSVIAFDRHGRLSELIRRKLAVSEEEWHLRIAESMMYVSWYCFPVEEHTASMIDLWSERGDPMSAQYAVSYALELIIGLLYALNRSFLPAPKWRIYCTHKLNWLPMSFAHALKEAMIIREISVDDARRRAMGLRPVWHEVLDRIYAEFKIDLEKAKGLYLEKVLHVSPR